MNTPTVGERTPTRSETSSQNVGSPSVASRRNIVKTQVKSQNRGRTVATQSRCCHFKRDFKHSGRLERFVILMTFLYTITIYYTMPSQRIGKVGCSLRPPILRGLQNVLNPLKIYYKDLFEQKRIPNRNFCLRVRNLMHVWAP